VNNKRSFFGGRANLSIGQTLVREGSPLVKLRNSALTAISLVPVRPGGTFGFRLGIVTVRFTVAGATSFRDDFVKQTSHPNRQAFASVASAWLVAPYAFYIRACQFDPFWWSQRRLLRP
jgi:hypothetical protein